MSRNKKAKPYPPRSVPLSRPHVPYITIISAKNGDYFALERILAEFRPMIHRMAIRTRYDLESIFAQITKRMADSLSYGLKAREGDDQPVSPLIAA